MIDHDMPANGWLDDPTGRHQYRYFANGTATDLVADNGVKTTDAPRPLGYVPPPSADTSGPDRRSHRKRRVVILAVVALAVVGGGIAAVIYSGSDSPDSQYLAALKEKGLSGQFTSDANAVAHAHQVCRQLADGGAQQGQAQDQVAVDNYCPSFADGFHILETITVNGSIVLHDSSYSAYFPSISTSGGTCEGDNGYNDITPGTQVTVKNGKGEVLATTTVESGSGGRTECSLPFTFKVTEGEDRYLVSISHRGDVAFTFAQLKTQGAQLSLGN